MPTATRILLVLFAACTPSGVHLEAAHSPASLSPGTVVTEIQGSKLRVDWIDASGVARVTTILNGDRLIMIDVPNKTYTEESVAALRVKMEMVRQSLANLPPAVRAGMEAKRQEDESTVTFKPVEGTDSVGGVECQNQEITKGSARPRVSCFAAWDPKGLRQSDLAAFESTLAVARSQLATLGGDLFLGDPARAPGWPLISRDAKGTELYRVTRLARGPIAESRFEPGPGLSKR